MDFINNQVTKSSYERFVRKVPYEKLYCRIHTSHHKFIEVVSFHIERIEKLHDKSLKLKQQSKQTAGIRDLCEVINLVNEMQQIEMELTYHYKAMNRQIRL
jgi:DNA-dependent RNA polymerase auxiliary subunit epsilon